MKSFLIAFVVFLVWSFFGLWLYSWLRPDAEKQLANGNVKTEQNTVTSLDTIQDTPIVEAPLDTLSTETEGPVGLKAVNQLGDVIFRFSEGITITKNSPSLEIPGEAVDFKYKLNTYLLEHPDSEIHILSMYSADENIESPNLGIQRARAIRDMLLDTGIDEDRIVVKPVIKEIAFDSSGSYSNSISFFVKPLDADRLERRNRAITVPETKIVYPRFSTQGIMVNDALKELLNEVVKLVEEYPDIQIEVVGHTDNVGNDTDNYVEGLSYARQVRWYLVTKGKINRKQIIATSRGEAEPLEGNDTRHGRNVNRRIEVYFQ